LAGLLTTPLTPVNFAQAASTGTFFTGAAPTAGIDLTGTGTGFATGWSTSNVLLIPNTSGNVMLWYYNGAGGAAGITQVLVGGSLAGQVLPASTTRTIAATESGWIGPFSPATYNVSNLNLVPAGIAASASIASWPAAALGCFAVAFTTTTNLSVRAYTFSNVQP
jgi:hypothetical protein